MSALAPSPFPTFAAARAAWSAKMVASGRVQAAELARLRALGPRSEANPEGWDANTWYRTYYDAIRVFQNVFDHTGDPAWLRAVDDAVFFYRDTYAAVNGYSLPGYFVFPHGLAEHFRRTGDLKSREAAIALSRNSAFMTDADAAGTVHASQAREAAYALMAHLIAESLGEPRREVTDAVTRNVLGHHRQWFGVPADDPAYVRPQPFIVALSCEALIMQDARTPGGDPRVLPAIEAACDALWDLHWRADGSFNYIDTDGRGEPDVPSHDLNLLICPIYGYAFARTGRARHRERGDLAFMYGIIGAWTDHANAFKQYDQCYRWSADYERWRGRSFVTVVPPGDKPARVRTEVPFDGVPRSYLLDDAGAGAGAGVNMGGEHEVTE